MLLQIVEEQCPGLLLFVIFLGILYQFVCVTILLVERRSSEIERTVHHLNFSMFARYEGEAHAMGADAAVREGGGEVNHPRLVNIGSKGSFAVNNGDVSNLFATAHGLVVHRDEVAGVANTLRHADVDLEVRFVIRFFRSFLDVEDARAFNHEGDVFRFLISHKIEFLYIFGYGLKGIVATECTDFRTVVLIEFSKDSTFHLISTTFTICQIGFLVDHHAVCRIICSNTKHRLVLAEDDFLDGQHRESHALALYILPLRPFYLWQMRRLPTSGILQSSDSTFYLL